MELDEEESEEPQRFAKQNALMGSAAADGDSRVLTVPFLRKYLYYCKTKFSKQQLTQEAFEEISQFYVEVRQAAATGVVDPRFRCACSILL
jgi:DNA replicative helicase MCM subunit Mcm2 (Cdc46/Mcm family)